MKALVKFGQKDGDVELREVPEPEIGPEDVLLEVRAAGICGADIEMWRHKMGFAVEVPVILGHEFCGVIAQAGDNVKGFSKGDRVVSETPAYICGKCVQCRTGNYNLCPERKGFGVRINGAFTRFVKVPQRILHRIPDAVSFEQACLTEPACVAYHALMVLSRPMPGEPALIIGPGPIGLFCLQMLQAAGAGPIVIVGTGKDKVRFQAAKQLGADYILDAAKDDVRQTIADLTAGQGVSLVVDAAGNESALALAIDLVARRGQVTKIGWGPKPINMSLDPLLSKTVKLQGTFSHTWSDWEAVLKMISRGAIRMKPLITHRAKIEDWLANFKAAEECRTVKAIFIMEK